jgi:hypothetical protein
LVSWWPGNGNALDLDANEPDRNSSLGPEHEVNKMNEYQLPSTDPYDDPYELRFIRDAPNCDEYYI